MGEWWEGKTRGEVQGVPRMGFSKHLGKSQES